jgi:oxepin-CoA hydrolase / 3-oxo-5,6-dehydrosuberyl-CoA semialdehyde dehydrogenase
MVNEYFDRSRQEQSPMNAPIRLESFLAGTWLAPAHYTNEIHDAVTGDVVALAGSSPADMSDVVRHARKAGAALRQLTFHQRAELLKKLAQHLTTHKEALYTLSYHSGATRADSWIDIEGGIGTLFVFASKGKRELPNAPWLIDGDVEALSREGTFIGRHAYVPRDGIAVQINAFNFPVWGMLEKLGPAILAACPVIVKPATATAYLAEACVRLMHSSGILPEGALQLICGPTGNLFDHLTGQDMVAFTGSLQTSTMLQAHPGLLRNAVKFSAERDSLNCSILGLDVTPDMPEFDLFVKEVAREMTAKAGQKCTAIRRVMVHEAMIAPVENALSNRLSKIVIGDPRLDATRMGALVSQAQRKDVREKVAALTGECDVVFGSPDNVDVVGADAQIGAFLSPLLLRAKNARSATRVHDVEAFGPVATLLPYRTTAEAAELANRGEGSLAGSLITADADVAREIIAGAGPYHGRMLILDRTCAKESTGHGSPMPHLIHGGPGRAGGCEELGGIRAVKHHMHRMALQGSPQMITKILGSWIRGAETHELEKHPFRYGLDELTIGQTLVSREREVTLADIEHFAHFTGDTFYAHMDEKAVEGHPFFPGRVAHGYLLLSFAAGLFVEPARGPVLANYGLDNLRFQKPVSPGDAIKVRLTVKSKARRNDEYGEVRWDVEISNAANETVATYDLLTMNAYGSDA